MSGVRMLAALLSTLAVVSLASCTGAPGPGKAATDERAGPQETHALRQGRRLYRLSCAGCHGADARGNGPIAPVLKLPVPDLTLIAARRGGVFPDDEIYRIIDGQADLTAHGPRHMPVWGYEFFGDDADDEAAHREATDKIERLSDYLRSIQRPATRPD